MCHIRGILVFMVFISSCILLPTPEFKREGEEWQLQEIKKMNEDKLYEEAITNCQEFKKKFPKSKFSDVVLLRLGEALEGLLEKEYHQPIKNGVAEESARKHFLERYGHYQCWVEKERDLSYNLTHYKEMMEKFPESNYADEASYHLIPWVDDYKGLPEGPLKEIGQVEKILHDYPTTSLKAELYYQIAYRMQVLYELYAFSSQPGVRNPEEAKSCREKAVYFYNLALSQPTQSKFSRSAWEGLRKLEEGKRIYLTE